MNEVLTLDRSNRYRVNPSRTKKNSIAHARKKRNFVTETMAGWVRTYAQRFYPCILCKATLEDNESDVDGMVDHPDECFLKPCHMSYALRIEFLAYGAFFLCLGIVINDRRELNSTCRPQEEFLDFLHTNLRQFVSYFC